MSSDVALSGDLAASSTPGSVGLPTIGVDPGQTWTAAVLRVGEYPEYGWTLGPIGADGQLLRAALNEPDDWVAFRRYAGRLRDALDELVEYAIQRHGAVRLAVEVPLTPVGFGELAKRPNRMPVRDWLIPRQVASVVLGAYPDARVVVPDHHGAKPASEYPKELRGRRLPHWGPCEARGGERDHERAAYDIAGAGAVMPR